MKNIGLILWLIILSLCVYLILNIPVYITANHPILFTFLFVSITIILLVIIVWDFTTLEKLKNFKTILKTNSKWSPWIGIPLFLFSWFVWPFIVYFNFENDKTIELEKYGIKSSGEICKTWKIPNQRITSERSTVSHKVNSKTYYFIDRLPRGGFQNRIEYNVKITYSKRYPYIGKIDREK